MSCEFYPARRSWHLAPLFVAATQAWLASIGALPVAAQTSTPIAARAQAPREGEALSLRAALAAALSANPDLVAARLRVDSARAERSIARALPNPTLTATPGNPAQYGAQLPFDVGPARYYRVKVSAQGQTAAELDL